VFLFVGLTVGLVLTATGGARRAAVALLVVQLAQGTIGFVQYFTDLPEVLVGFHLFGAALVSAAMTWALLSLLGRSSAADVAMSADMATAP
jgi:cytochrome c oxidase assembly protein subunit 15